MSSRTKLAIIISSVLVVVVSLVVCLVVVKGLPDLDDIKDRLENQSQVEITQATKAPKNTKAPETEVSTDAVTMTEVSVISTTNATSLPPFTAPVVHTTRPTTISGAVYLSSISISSLPNKTTYYSGDTFSTSGMSVSAKYSDGTTAKVSGTVDSYPNMYSVGSQQISVSYSDSYGNKKYDSFYITIKSPAVSISSTSVYLDVGESYYNLYATTDPQSSSVTWKSTSPGIASVDGSGNITARSPGTTSITASITVNGKVYTSSACRVTVSKPQTTSPPESTLTIEGVDQYEYTTYEDYTVRIDDITGYIESNYYLDYVNIGIEGPVYVNGRYDIITQDYYFYDDDINSSIFYLNEYYYDFDYIPYEDYVFYVYATDKSGESVYDEWDINFD